MEIVVILGLLAAILWVTARDDPRRRRLTALAAELGGSFEDWSLAVPYEGVAVTVRYFSANDHQRWTYVEARLPPGYPFDLYVRRHMASDPLAIERGDLVDLAFGDHAFDAEFVVEGAPEAIVRRVLDASRRRQLRLSTFGKLDTANGVLHAMIPGWVERAEGLRPWVAFIAELVADVRAATASEDASVPMSMDGGAYRGIPDAAPLEAARATRVDEVARIGQVQRSRANRAAGVRVRNFVVTGAIVVALVYALGQR